MFGNLIGNASLLELAWMINAGIGIAFSLRNWKSAREDYHLTGMLKEGNGRRTIAVSTLTIESLILFKFAIFVILGLVAVSVPSTGSLTSFIFGFMLLASTVALTAISAVNRRTSQYLLEFGVRTSEDQDAVR